MNLKSLFIALLFTSAVFSQSQIYYYKDSTSQLTPQDATQKEFTLLSHEILEKYSDDIHWFKIPAMETNDQYIARIEYDRIKNARAYQNGKVLERLPNERYISYRFSRDSDVYIRVNPSLHSYIPVEVYTEEKSMLRDRNQLLLNGFYYGFAFLTIVYSLFYFFLFKDEAFLYYALLLSSVSFGLFILDGMLNFFDLSDSVNDFLNIINYVFLAIFSSKFANSYLFLDNHFPNHKKLSYSLSTATIITVILYLIFKSYYLILLVNIFVFTILFSYWMYAVLLFRKNVYTKFLVFADAMILFTAIDFFILKFLGICIIHIDAMSIKLGAFLEMILLSIAVLYRMKSLKAEYRHMRNEIIKFSAQLASQKQSINRLDLLSVREREIFNLIVLINTNKEIAHELNVSVNTVKFHIKNIYEKLEISSRKEAFTIAETALNKGNDLITTP
jgi:DNA-binding CsgD family transcriptional regulator